MKKGHDICYTECHISLHQCGRFSENSTSEVKISVKEIVAQKVDWVLVTQDSY